LGRRLEQVRITEVRDNVFYAELILDQNTKVSARVSDAIALALHLGVAIHAEDSVLDTAAVCSAAAGRRTPSRERASRTAGWICCWVGRAGCGPGHAAPPVTVDVGGADVATDAAAHLRDPPARGDRPA
jgi:hypothetical protein